MNDIKKLKVKYFCSKCDTYHKPKFKSKINQTFIKHQKYMKEISQSYIFNKTLKKSFRTYDINKHSQSRGSNKQ